MAIAGIGAVSDPARKLERAAASTRDALGIAPGNSLSGWQEIRVPGGVRFALEAPEGDFSETEVRLRGGNMGFRHTIVAPLRDSEGNFVPLSRKKPGP
jgi:hypothetical protein